MAKNHSINTGILGLRYPDLRIGFVFATISLSWWLIKSQINSPLAGIIICVCVAGLIYLYWCIFRIHQIMKKITGGKISYSPSQAVVYLFIPLFNNFWAFVWISRIARALNELQGSKKTKVLLPGLIFSFSLSVWLLAYLFPLSLFASFFILSYLVKNIKETIAFDAAGAKIIAGNTLQSDLPQETKKHSFWGLIKIAGVILLLIFVSLPLLLLLPVQREGIKLVPLIENYKITHGIYPDSLSQLTGEVKYSERMHYETDDKRAEFKLVCYGGWTTRVVYKSVSGKWENID
jgi:hypothetical protein